MSIVDCREYTSIDPQIVLNQFERMSNSSTSGEGKRNSKPGPFPRSTGGKPPLRQLYSTAARRPIPLTPAQIAAYAAVRREIEDDNEEEDNSNQEEDDSNEGGIPRRRKTGPPSTVSTPQSTEDDRDEDENDSYRGESDSDKSDGRPEILRNDLDEIRNREQNDTEIDSAILFTTAQTRQNFQNEPAKVASDSGYHTGLGTDTESVCSMESTGSSLGLPKDFLDEFIAFFGDMLVEKSGAHAWDEQTLLTRFPEAAQKHIIELLKEYAIKQALGTDVLPASESQIQQAHQATKLVRRYRPEIARYFLDHARSTQIDVEPMNERLGKLSKQLSLAEKISLFDKNSSIANVDLGFEIDEESEDEDDEECADLKPIYDFLISGEAFHDLVKAMRSSLCYGDQESMNLIRNQVLKRLAQAVPLQSETEQHRDRKSSTYLVLFNVAWDLDSFLHSEYSPQDLQVGSLIALTGSASYAQATTCAHYISSNWPCSGPLFLAELQRAIDSRGNMKWDPDDDLKAHPTTDGLNASLSLQGRIAGHQSLEGRLLMQVSGTEERLVELAQQLAWLGSALSSSPYGKQLAFKEPKIESPHLQNVVFNLSFQAEPLTLNRPVCWQSLFFRMSIARGFPIPDRQGEIGLEIPINIMAAIAGAHYAFEYKNGIIMKGFSCVLTPQKKNLDVVQWHLNASPDSRTSFSYQDVNKHCQERAKLAEISLEDVQTKRAILGWCTDVTSLLGTHSANYGNICYSTAKNSTDRVRLTDSIFGFQQFGLAQLSFTFWPNQRKWHCERSWSYEDIISAAEKTPVVLYDITEKRGWLVQAIDVMLHIAYHRNHLQPFEVDGRRIDLFSVEHLEHSTKERFFKHRCTQLRNNKN